MKVILVYKDTDPYTKETLIRLRARVMREERLNELVRDVRPGVKIIDIRSFIEDGETITNIQKGGNDDGNY